MFGFFKNLLRKPSADSPEGQQQLAYETEAPQAPAPRPAPAPAATRSHARPSGSRQNAGIIELPLQNILNSLPLELQARVRQPDVGDLTISVPLEKILAQLSRGVVKVAFGELRQALPDIFTAENDRDRVLVALPLGDVLERLNPALITRRRAQRQVHVPEDISSPFEPESADCIYAVGPASPAPVPAPAPPQRIAPTRPALTPSRSEMPPTAAPVPPTVTPVPIAASPVPLAAPVRPRFEFPVQPTPPAPPPLAQPPPHIAPAQSHHTAFVPKPPERARFEHTSPPPSFVAPVEQAPPAYVAPVLPPVEKPVAPTPPAPAPIPFAVPNPKPSPRIVADGSRKANGQAPTAPIPVPQAPKTPEVVEEPVILPLSTLADGWPETVRQEIVDLGLAETKVALPAHSVEQALKQGRIAFSWKMVRSWIRPAVLSVVSPHDGTVLELPLRVVAPLFLARQREKAKPQEKVNVDEDIPNLFFGFPQPDNAPGGAAATAKPADTNFYVWDDSSDTAKVHESETKRGPTPGTKFVAKYATPNEIVSRAASLDGVAGALIALPDGLMVANRLPPDLNADTLAAFLPQIFGKTSQTTKELRMGDLNNLHFTVGNIPWKIFRVNSIFFAAFGRAGEPLPTGQLAALAAELDHKPK
jgi:predicted regulator of Ras-like GTPase activity (Roadblock/LC7/MglB family)